MKRACLLGGTLFFAKSAEIGKKMLDKTADPLYNLKAVKNAAIAQSVERILGKDEVASSNLAISFIRPSEMTVFLLCYGVYLHKFSVCHAF